MIKKQGLFGTLGASALALAAFTGTASPAKATEGDWAYSLTITLVSDYMFRGISFTEEKPAFQPYLEFTKGMFYVGFWASNIDAFEVYGPGELDVYVGVRPTTGPVNWDIGVLYYLYGSRSPVLDWDDIDYFEFKVAATTSPIENLTLGVTGYMTPDQDTAVAETWTIEGTAAYTLPAWGMFTPTVSGLFAYTVADTSNFFLGSTDYFYWNAGLKLTVDKFFMDFRYWDTDISDGTARTAGFVNGNDFADARFLFSAGVTLP
jgi:uncharacterized protein (TIGR02001 family)